MKKKFSFKEVPTGYKLCFNDRCPRHEDCIRYLAGRYLPEEELCGPAIYPNALKEDGNCSYFKQTRIIHAAWGFRNLYKGLEPKDAQILKARVTNHLGGPVACFAYMHGEKLLTPEQQESIHELFKEMGYEKVPVFDGFTSIYDFSE